MSQNTTQGGNGGDVKGTGSGGGGGLGGDGGAVGNIQSSGGYWGAAGGGGFKSAGLSPFVTSTALAGGAGGSFGVSSNGTALIRGRSRLLSATGDRYTLHLFREITTLRMDTRYWGTFRLGPKT
jgi:hypothetical protein